MVSADDRLMTATAAAGSAFERGNPSWWAHVQLDLCLHDTLVLSPDRASLDGQGEGLEQRQADVRWPSRLTSWVVRCHLPRTPSGARKNVRRGP